MSDQTNGAAPQQTVPAVPDSISLRSQIGTMISAFNRSDQRRMIFWLAGSAATIIVLTSLGQILLNRWNRPFYDAIERKDVDAFLTQLIIFFMIAGGLLALGVGQTWLNQMVRLKLREALTLDLIREWMRPRRAFRLANAGAIGVNPDQRMQQDAGHLADMTTGLGFGLFQSSILLVSFVGVLWSLSSGFVFEFGDRSISIPGYMVWAVFLYAGTASILSWLVGRPLIGLNSDRYAKEADLRFSMMRINEHVDAISVANGETDEKRRLEFDLASLMAAIKRIYKIQIRLEWVTDGYGWITLVAPILVASPIYFSGDMTFGGLMMSVGAFNQVHSSLRWFINNIGAIADWRATLLRVSAYRLALVEADALHDRERRIETAENARKTMTFDGVEIVSPAGATRFADPKVTIKAGERVLVTGDPGAGKTLLFRALAGLWPWGAGRIGLPKAELISFIPRTPYFPPGKLRDVLSYPHDAGAIADEKLSEALADVGLGHLAESLDRDARWEKDLSEEEQRLLAFARLGLQKPRWVVVDEALDTLDAPARRRVFAMLEEQLPKSTIVNIGRSLSGVTFFTRQVHLTKDAAGPALKPVDFGAREVAKPKPRRRWRRQPA